MIALATSVGTLLGMWLVARKDWRGWLVGICNQTLWLAFTIQTRAWGLLPLIAALLVIYSRALMRWRRAELPQPAAPQQATQLGDYDWRAIAEGMEQT